MLASGSRGGWAGLDGQGWSGLGEVHACQEASFSRARCCSTSSASWSARMEEVSTGVAPPPRAMAGAAVRSGDGRGTTGRGEVGRERLGEGRCAATMRDAQKVVTVRAGAWTRKAPRGGVRTDELGPALEIELDGVQLGDEQATLALEGVQHRHHLGRERRGAPEWVRKRGQSARRRPGAADFRRS